MIRRRYSNVPGPRPAHYAEPGSRPQEAVPWARVAGRICGERQIVALELACIRDGMRVHQKVAEILFNAIMAELDDPAFARSVKLTMAARESWQAAHGTAERPRGKRHLGVLDGGLS